MSSTTRYSPSERIEKLKLAREFYVTARTELIARIKLRENTLFVGVGVLATIFSIAFGQELISEEDFVGSTGPQNVADTRRIILLIVPYISAAVAIVLDQHNTIIGRLGVYCGEELQQTIDRLFWKSRLGVPQWDNSETLDLYQNTVTFHRAIAYLLLLVLPSAVSLLYTWVLVYEFDPSIIYRVIWTVGMIAFGFTIFLTIYGLLKRWKDRKKLHSMVS